MAGNKNLGPDWFSPPAVYLDDRGRMKTEPVIDVTDPQALLSIRKAFGIDHLL